MVNESHPFNLIRNQLIFQPTQTFAVCFFKKHILPYKLYSCDEETPSMQQKTTRMLLNVNISRRPIRCLGDVISEIQTILLFFVKLYSAYSVFAIRDTLYQFYIILDSNFVEQLLNLLRNEKFGSCIQKLSGSVLIHQYESILHIYNISYTTIYEPRT